MLAVFVLRPDFAEYRSIPGQLFDIFTFFRMGDVDRTIRYFDVRDIIFFQEAKIVIELVPDYVGFEKQTAKIDGDVCILEDPDLFLQIGRASCRERV